MCGYFGFNMRENHHTRELEGGGPEGAYFDLILNVGPYLFQR